MQSGLRIGSIFGIPLQIHPSWLVVVGLITLSNSFEWQVTHPDWGQPLTWGIGLTSALLLFASVLLHELGHSLVAKFQGIDVNSITLFLFGGMASIDKESKTPGQAFWVAIAGPAVSIVLALLLFWVAPRLTPGTPLSVLINDLARINLILALFNLIPGLPLDGGQILKAAVWKASGDRLKGVRWAARSGAFLGWSAILLAFAGVFLLEDPGLLWVGLLGWFSLQNARRYGQVTTLQERLLQLQAKDAMTRGFRVVDGDLSLESFTEDYLIPAKAPVYFAASNGRYCGLVEADNMQMVERSEWPSQPVRSLVQALDEIPTVTEQESLASVTQRLDAEELSFITVLSPAGAVAGVIDRGDLVRAVGQAMGFKFPSEEIDRIKAEGDYPPGLQLGAIAQALEL